MASNNYVLTVDYTSRDYASIRQDLINLIPTFAPTWTNRDPADFGMTLLELFSYMGDLINYYIDRSANEAFINTASQRQNVLSIATLLGYAATDSTAATVTLTFQNSTASPITVPALTQVATNSVSNGITSQIVFETDTSVVVPAKVGTTNGSATVTATQGVTVTNELVGTSDGNAGQSFALSQYPVINDSMVTTVGGINYEKVEYLIDYNGYDPVVVSNTDSLGITSVVFGDNISGRVPPSSTPVYVTYRVGGGAAGNVAAATIKYILSFPSSSVPAGLSVLNQGSAATGGADPESTDSIRVNAPLSIRSLNRAVSLDDYASLALQVSGVSKAVAVGSTYNSITLYFVPYGDTGVLIDGITPSTVFNTMKTDLQHFFVGKTPPGTTITYQPAKYVNTDIIINVTVLNNYKATAVQAAVTAAIQSLFYIDNVIFQDRISYQDVMATIAAIDGVAYSQIQKLVRADEDLTYTITNKASNGTVATLTTSAAHSLKVGQTVLVSGVDTTYNGVFVITAVASTTFSYALVSPTLVTTAATGSVTTLIQNDIVCAVNEVPQIATGGLTVNTVGGIVG
jgi:hypothetical protein